MSLNGKLTKNTRKRRIPRWGRYSLRSIGVACCFVFAVGGSTWVWNSSWPDKALHLVWQSVAKHMAGSGLRVEEVVLQGRRNASADRIRNVLGIQRGTPLLAINLQQLRQQLETLPWIRFASLERQYPNIIHVKIAERRPIALWQRENKLVLVDEGGTIITSNKLEKFSNLIVVVGKGAPLEAASLMSFLEQEPKLKQRVNAAVRVGDRRWNIHMDNGVHVRLPEKRPEVAWRRFARLEQKHKLLKQNLLSIDLRIPDQMIVRTRTAPPITNHNVNHQEGKNT